MTDQSNVNRWAVVDGIHVATRPDRQDVNQIDQGPFAVPSLRATQSRKSSILTFAGLFVR
jgi:predicted butyrate kinase (DUF1464 family)